MANYNDIGVADVGFLAATNLSLMQYYFVIPGSVAGEGPGCLPRPQMSEDSQIHPEPGEEDELEDRGEADAQQEEPVSGLQENEEEADRAGPGAVRPKPESGYGTGDPDPHPEEERSRPPGAACGIQEEEVGDHRCERNGEKGEHGGVPWPAGSGRSLAPPRSARCGGSEVPGQGVSFRFEVHLGHEAEGNGVALVEEDVLGNLIPDGEQGVQGLHRFLEDHGDAVPAYGLQLRLRLLEEIEGPLQGGQTVHEANDRSGSSPVLQAGPEHAEAPDAEVGGSGTAKETWERLVHLRLEGVNLHRGLSGDVEERLTLLNPPGRLRDEAEHREGRDALPAPRLAHETQGLPLPEVEAHPLEGLDIPRVGVEVRLQVPDSEEQVRRRLTSAAEGPGRREGRRRAG